MKSIRNMTAIVVCAVVSLSVPASAQHSGFTGFSEAFLRDYKSAEDMVNQKKSADPFIALLQHYTSPAEQAELEVSIGLVYNQATGVVNPASAVGHFTKALKFDLPEKTYIQVLMWRGSSQEQLKNFDAAMKDYLRGMLACSQYDLSGGWPEIQGSKLTVYVHSDDPENDARMRDYRVYRRQLDFQQFALMQRYFFIDAIKRVRGKTTDAQILDILQTLTPDSSKFGAIVGLVNSENKRPWP